MTMLMRNIFVLLLLSTCVLAQDYDPKQGYDIEFEGPLFEIDMPILLGGYDSVLKEFIYPEDALAEKIEGTVTITCIIDIDGHAQDIKAILGPKQLMRAAEDAVEFSQWSPGRYKRMPTPLMVRFDLDIRIENTAELKEAGSKNYSKNLILGPLFFGIIYLILT